MLQPQTLQALTRARFRVGLARAARGTGERPSGDKGAGMEFADHKLYVAGDDTRHLDARLHARLGEFYLRQFEVPRQLAVTILLDASASMRTGGGGKLAAARWLADALGYVGLAGGDRVRVAFWSGSALVPSPVFSGAGRADRLFEWVAGQQPAGEGAFDTAFARLGGLIGSRELVIVLSDWWVADPAACLLPLHARKAEVWSFQVLDPEEIAPSAAAGENRLIDAETGEEVRVTLDDRTLAAYESALQAMQAGLKALHERAGGRFLSLRTDQNLETQSLHRLRNLGLVVG